MRLMVPDYYDDFHCIADACRHSCCVGWEIDVDPQTAGRYRQMPGTLGDKLRAVMESGPDETIHFRLDERERCPMLRVDGLCEIICEAGEGLLCQICTDHPRWRNYYSDRTEMGLGLCCEEAARQIVDRASSGCFVTREESAGTEKNDPEEETLLQLRDTLMDSMKDHRLNITERFTACAEVVGMNLSFSCDAAEQLLRPLERLESSWDDRLDLLSSAEWETCLAEYPQQAENLAVYLLMRHMPGALEDGMTVQRVLFALWGAILILCVSRSAADIADAARQFSGEIEYSDENLWAVLDWLGGSDGADTLL